MAAASRGTWLALLLFSLIHHRHASADTVGGRCRSASVGDAAHLDRHETQLLRLQRIVDSLSVSVSRLESALSKFSPTPPPAPVPSASATPAVDTSTDGGEGAGSSGAVAPTSPVTVTKFKFPWSERFQFVAAARLESEPTCAVALPYVDHDGLTKYFALGDSRGRALVFSSAGDVLADLPAPPSSSPVTATVAFFSIRRNESLLITGHGDGSIVAHRLWESASNGDDWPVLVLGASRSLLQEGDQATPSITGLEARQIGRLKYIIASDHGGRIRVFRENGTLYGTAIASGPPLAFAKQRLLFLTENGAGSVDLRRFAVTEALCEGLDGARVESYAFDALDRSKAYGFTAHGHLVNVQLLGDAATLKCRVRAMRKTDIEGPITIHAVKGYLLAVSREKVFIYNVSSQYYGRVGPPRPLFSATLEEIRSVFLNSYGNSDGISGDGSNVLAGRPLIAGDRDRLLILGLGGRYIGIYRSNFPVFRPASSAVLWSSPVLLFLMFLTLMWYFYVKKKDVLGWTPEAAFNTSMDGPVGMAAGTAGDRTVVDGSRAGDHRDMRGAALRGPPRRYISPPRYAGGSSATTFRPGVSSDAAFRGTGDLKYRGQMVEPPGFPKRREPIFANSQVADDNVE